mgnify:CR=1 FL=1
MLRIIATFLYLIAIKKDNGSQKYPPKGMPNPLDRSYPIGLISIRLSKKIMVSNLLPANT